LPMVFVHWVNGGGRVIFKGHDLRQGVIGESQH